MFEKRLSRQLKELTLLQKVLLALSGFVCLINVNTFENNTYPSYFLVLLIGLLGPFSSKHFRNLLSENLNLKIILLLIIGLFLRIKFSLFNFLHLNYHGHFYLLSISTLQGFEETPYGFSYNIFWHPLKHFIGLSKDFLFYGNILLNILSAFLLYALMKKWTKKESIAIITASLFIFSPLQVAVSGTESHFILCSFFLLFLLVQAEDSSSQRTIFLPYTLAFTTFIRPGLFLIFPAFFIYLFSRKKIKQTDYFYFIMTYLMLALIPLSVAGFTLFKVLFNSNIPVFTVFSKPGYSLNLFKLKYYLPIYSFLASIGIALSLLSKKYRGTALALGPLALIVLLEAILKHSEWHISIYYQTTIEIFYFLLMALSCLKIEKVFKRKSLFLYSLMTVIISYQFIDKIFIYNEKYDEQLEQKFLNDSLKKYQNNFSIYTTFHDIGSGTEIFSPILFFNNDLGITNKILTVKEMANPNVRFPLRDQLNKESLYYRSLSERQDSFKAIEATRGLIPLETFTFKFKQRFFSHFSEGSNVTVGFYRITK